MRTAAISLAVATAVGELLVFAYGEAQLDLETLGQLGGGLAPWWGRALWAVGWALPWVVGAAILAWGPARIGTAVVVAVAVLSLAEVVGVIQLGVQALGTSGGDGGAVTGAVGFGASWLLGTAAGITAWLARPRGGWRTAAPGPGALFTVAAIAAWLPTAFRSTAFAPPGAPRRFIEPLAADVDLASAGFVAYPAVVALVLLAAPRLQPAVAGAVTLTFAVPQLVSHTATLRAAVLQELTILTPAGVLGLAGALGLVAVSMRWVVPRRQGRISDAATDHGRAEEG